MSLALRTVGSALATPTLIAGLATLEDIIRRPAFTLLDVIVQDEYTHDVIVSAGTAYLVFDTT
jgi:hypothetical protein